MSAAVLGLAAGYALLGGLLLALNLRAWWSWRLKAAAIVLTAVATTLQAAAVADLLGWPSPTPPPERFRVLAAQVVEPGPAGQAGAIYLWLEGGEAPPDPPRAHALPYSRALHERLARLLAEAGDGRELQGRRALPPWGESRHDLPLELFLAAPPPPAAKPDRGARLRRRWSPGAAPPPGRPARGRRRCARR